MFLGNCVSSLPVVGVNEIDVTNLETNYTEEICADEFVEEDLSRILHSATPSADELILTPSADELIQTPGISVGVFSFLFDTNHIELNIRGIHICRYTL